MRNPSAVAVAIISVAAPLLIEAGEIVHSAPVPVVFDQPSSVIVRRKGPNYLAAISGDSLAFSSEQNFATVLQAAIDAVGGVHGGGPGGLVLVEAGTYEQDSTVVFRPNYQGWVTVRGEPGAVIKITRHGVSAFSFQRESPYDTIQNVTVEDLQFDANQTRRVGQGGAMPAHAGVIFGVRSGGDAHYNLRNVRIRDLRAFNLPRPPFLTHDDLRAGIELGVSNDGQRHCGASPYLVCSNDKDCVAGTGPCEFRPTSFSNVAIERVAVEGGSTAVAVTGGGGNTGRHSLEFLTIRDCTHDPGVATAEGVNANNFHVGSYAVVRHATIEGIVGLDALDTGLELNNCVDCVVRDSTFRNPRVAGVGCMNHLSEEVLDDWDQSGCLVNNVSVSFDRDGLGGFAFGVGKFEAKVAATGTTSIARSRVMNTTGTPHIAIKAHHTLFTRLSVDDLSVYEVGDRDARLADVTDHVVYIVNPRFIDATGGEHTTRVSLRGVNVFKRGRIAREAGDYRFRVFSFGFEDGIVDLSDVTIDADIQGMSENHVSVIQLVDRPTWPVVPVRTRVTADIDRLRLVRLGDDGSPRVVVTRPNEEIDATVFAGRVESDRKPTTVLFEVVDRSGRALARDPNHDRFRSWNRNTVGLGRNADAVVFCADRAEDDRCLSWVERDAAFALNGRLRLDGEDGGRALLLRNNTRGCPNPTTGVTSVCSLRDVLTFEPEAGRELVVVTGSGARSHGPAVWAAAGTPGTAACGAMACEGAWDLIDEKSTSCSEIANLRLVQCM